MLNPEKYNDSIAEMEEKVEYREEELTEAQDKFRKAGKDIRRATFAAISFLLFLVAEIFLLIYPSTQAMIFEVLKIDITMLGDLTYYGTWCFAAFYLAAVIAAAICICWGGEEGLGIGLGMSAFLPLGVWFLFSNISTYKDFRKEAKKEIATKTKQVQELSARLGIERAKKQAEEKALAESNALVARGKAENREDLIRQAADMGNGDAADYLEKQEAARCYQRAKEVNPADQTLLEKAAALGHPQAALEVAERLLAEAEVDRYTKNEKEAMKAQADTYLKKAVFDDCPDGAILQMLRDLSDKTVEQYHQMLEKVRALQEAGKLSPKYTAVAEELAAWLIRKINYLEENRVMDPKFEISDPGKFINRVHESLYPKYKPVDIDVIY